MNREEILNAIKSLASSQGFYCRLYERLTAETEYAEHALNVLEQQNFKDVVELVMWLEC